MSMMTSAPAWNASDAIPIDHAIRRRVETFKGATTPPILLLRTGVGKGAVSVPIQCTQLDRSRKNVRR